MNESMSGEILLKISEIERDLKFLTDKINSFIEIWHQNEPYYLKPCRLQMTPEEIDNLKKSSIFNDE